jgi:hypothetical protein
METTVRILYFSDVHIEIRADDSRVPWTDIYPLDLGPDLSAFVGAVDLLVLAGDIGTIRPRGDVSTVAYAEQVAAYLRCPVVIVPGNHEYYRGCFEDDREALIATKVLGVTALDRGEAFVPVRNQSLRILGATLWTDYALLGDPKRAMLDAALSLNDHRLIRRRNGSMFMPDDALAEHRVSRKWLAKRLEEPHPGPTLVVTHHVPHSVARHPGYGENALSPAFCSDCDDLIAAAGAAQVAAWIYGHHHWSHQLEIGGVRLLSAQPGYPGERTGWSGPGVLEI